MGSNRKTEAANTSARSTNRFIHEILRLCNIGVNQPLLADQAEIPADPDYQVIKQAVHEVKALLAEGKIALNSEFEVEYSHHYGIRKFREYGAVIINVINREYCKKVLVQLPGQKHPAHFHKLKEETFQVLHGELRIFVDGRERVLFPGDIGCGAGSFLDTCCGQAAKQIAVEPCVPFQPSLRERGYQVFGGTHDAAAAFPASADLIVSIQVIEHVADPVGFLRDMGPLLKRDGTLLITTPT